MNELEGKAQEVAQIFKLLSHPKRLLILCKLSGQSLTVGQLEDQCKLSQSQLSQFLQKLAQEGIVQGDRQGQYIIYSIKDIRVIQLMQMCSQIYCNHG